MKKTLGTCRHNRPKRSFNFHNLTHLKSNEDFLRVGVQVVLANKIAALFLKVNE